jgi:glycosyltransferase involved in cell wall biosynthesis
LGYIPGNGWYDKNEESKMIKLADLCYASSVTLVDKFRRLRSDIRLLPNAVDKEQFSRIPDQKPADLKKGEITIGFWGMFWTDWFDWDLIQNAARKKPKWTFNLIGGKPAKIKKEIKGIPKNINLIRQKKWEDLYKYLYFFDVCIIPYISKTGSREANPIKALEYIAGYKPVVSYRNESLRDIPYLYCYKNSFDFIKKIEIANKVKINVTLVDNFLKKNTWEHRLTTIISELEKTSNKQ